MELPGLEFASSMGFEVYCYSGDRSSVSYTKNGISLDIWDTDSGLQCRISYIYKLITCSSPILSLPNKNFPIYLSQVYKIKQLTSSEG